MKNLQQWFLRQQRRATRVVSLYQAALSHNIYPYIFYRLRFFSFNTLLFGFCGLAEYYFLFFYMGISNTIHIAGLRFIAVAIYSSWWAFTEILRTRIRHYFKHRKREFAAKEISSWLTLGCCVASTVFVVVGFYIYATMHASISHQHYLWRAYGALIALHISISLLTGVLHSALYALKRINRPFISLSLARLLGLLSILLTYSWLKDYALAGAYLVESIVGVSVSWYYMLRMNRIMDILPRRFVSFYHFPRFLCSLCNRHTLVLVVVGIGLSSQMLLFYYVFWYTSLLYHYSLLGVIFVIALQFNQLFSWPNLFYFDLKRLENPKLANIKKMLIKGLNFASFIIAIGMWLFSAFIVELFSKNWAMITLLLLPLYLMQSRYALKCMELFCDFRYWDIVFSAVVTASSTLLLLSYPSKSYGFYFCAFLTIIFFSRVVAFMTRFSPLLPPEMRELQVTPFFDLMREIANRDDKLEIVMLQFMAKATGSQKYLVYEKLLSLGKVAVFSDNVVAFVPHSSADKKMLHEVTGGLTFSAFNTGVQCGGKIVLNKVLGYLRHDILSDARAANKEEVERTYAYLQVIDLSKHETSGNLKLRFDMNDCGSIVGAALRFVEAPLKEALRSPYRVVAAEVDGAINKLYIARPGKGRSMYAYNAWRNEFVYAELKRVLSL